MKTYYKTFVSCEFKWQIKRFSKKAKHWDMEDIMIHKYLEVEKGYRSWKVLPFIKIPSPSDCCPPSWICHIGRAVHRKDNLGTTIFVVLETKWPIRSTIWHQAWIQDSKWRKKYWCVLGLTKFSNLFTRFNTKHFTTGAEKSKMMLLLIVR